MTPIGNDVDKALEHLYLVEDHFDYPEDISKAIDWLQKLSSGKAVWVCKGNGYWVESKTYASMKLKGIGEVLFDYDKEESK